MDFRIVPRTEFGLPAEVRSSTGSLRPPLSNERWMTAHYTGTTIDYKDRVTTDVVLQIQRVFYDSKPFEYNYVIGQADDDEIVEFAGKFQAAHSGGENADSFGVLFLLGVGDDPTPLMIEKWRWLRDVLIADGSLRPDVDQRMHKDMPGAATACPGEIAKFWPEFLKPSSAVPPVEGKPVFEFPKVLTLQGQPGAFVQWEGGYKTWLPTPDVRDAFLTAYELQVVQVPEKAWFVSAGPVVGPIPEGYDGWGVKL